jgi:hypothetical protein
MKKLEGKHVQPYIKIEKSLMLRKGEINFKKFIKRKKKTVVK